MEIKLLFFEKEHEHLKHMIHYFKYILFPKVTVKVIPNCTFSHTYNNSIAVIWRTWPKALDYFKKAHDNNHSVGAIHIGHEKYEPKKIKWYKYAKFVLKKGYNKEYQSYAENVYWIPTGISSMESICYGEDKKYLYNFVGTTGNTSFRSIDRNDLNKEFLNKDKRKDKYVLIKKGGTGPLSAKEYYKVLSYSKFTICAYGNNKETMRHWEALEVGSIPICKDAEYLTILNDHPYVIIKNYGELNKFFEDVTEEYIRGKEMEVKEWWIKQKGIFSEEYYKILLKYFNNLKLY